MAKRVLFVFFSGGKDNNNLEQHKHSYKFLQYLF